MGSGFVIQQNLVLTNAHVVGSSSKVNVVLHDGRRLIGQVVERASEEVDLALVRITAPDLAVLPVGDLRQLRVGSWAGSVGHGKGALWAFNTGHVSNIYTDGTERSVFQTQIPLNPGSSGAPVFDRLGRVVGVVTAGIERANSINFALKIDQAFKHLRGLNQQSPSLTILAPSGTPVLVDGSLAGSGPQVTLRAVPKKYAISAVIGGQLRRLVIEFPKDRVVDLR
jgi:serine protease Do